MKKIGFLLFVAVLGISLCVFFILKKGTSLRPQVLISASAVGDDPSLIGVAAFKRLFPKLQASDFVVLGFLPLDTESEKVLRALSNQYFETFHETPKMIERSRFRAEDCAKPCWILVGRDQAAELQVSDPSFGGSHFSLTWVPFSKIPEPTNLCLEQRMLSLSCLKELSIHLAARKMKATQRNFFMNSYNDRDFFLFVQDSGISLGK